MQKAGKEEKQHAIDKENLTVVDGKEISYITVIVDDGWSKRFYATTHHQDLLAMEIPVYTPELKKEFPTDDKNKSFFIQARKLLSTSCKGISPLERLVKGVRMAIKKAGNEVGQKYSLVRLQPDLLNAPYNVFGVSSNRKDENEDDNIKIIEQGGGLLTEIKEVIDPLVRKSDLLAYNETTNQAEQYNIRRITYFNHRWLRFLRTIQI
ncbi:hypothetical protein ILUMI_18342 [Ignelater luminosus]|uniref:Uncharacterized protein n=1 Tax=Ignelater luminosus TaxID=2038154 RepID=A0A8K0CMQ6_IGNLU|nr:hypothetical protein ILUMI_18342 [Ignelater luminosus]